jgi:uncharacterized protein
MTILNRNLNNSRLKTCEGDMNVDGLYTAGPGNEIFLKKLRDEGQIVGSYDAKTKQTFLPTRLFNEQTMHRLTETKTITSQATLKTFSTVHVTMDGCPSKEPKTVGFVTYKGIEGGIVHYIETRGKKLKVGLKVKPVFAPKAKRTGSILDILYFECV